MCIRVRVWSSLVALNAWITTGCDTFKYDNISLMTAAGSTVSEKKFLLHQNRRQSRHSSSLCKQLSTITKDNAGMEPQPKPTRRRPKCMGGVRKIRNAPTLPVAQRSRSNSMTRPVPNNVPLIMHKLYRYRT